MRVFRQSGLFVTPADPHYTKPDESEVRTKSTQPQISRKSLRRSRQPRRRSGATLIECDNICGNWTPYLEAKWLRDRQVL